MGARPTRAMSESLQLGVKIVKFCSNRERGFLVYFSFKNIPKLKPEKNVVRKLGQIEFSEVAGASVRRRERWNNRSDFWLDFQAQLLNLESR